MRVLMQREASRAKKKLRWQPTVSFEELVRDMVDGDMAWYSKHHNP
jgi:GDP-D-mannose dehydratase